MQPLQICIGPTIRIRRESWCLPYAGFFVRSSLYESRGDQKYPIWVISDLLSDIQKLIPGGSCIYTISCKASYTVY